MTLTEMRNDLGSLINQADGSGFSSTTITTTEANRWLNQAYEEVYMWYALANKKIFQQEATVDLSDGVSEYTFGGDATDVMAIIWLGLKYSSTDTFYKKAWPMSYPDSLLVGNETYSEGVPVYYNITKKVSGVPTAGVRIDPEPEDDITAGMKIFYLERPAALTDSDSPSRLPRELHKWIVLGASVNCLFKLGLDEKAELRQVRFDKKLSEYKAMDQVKNSDKVYVIRPVGKRRVSVFNDEN